MKTFALPSCYGIQPILYLFKKSHYLASLFFLLSLGWSSSVSAQVNCTPCEAKETQVTRITLVNEAGLPLEETCTDGVTQVVKLLATGNANTNRYGMIVTGDIYIDDVFVKTISQCYGYNASTGENLFNGDFTLLLDDNYNWECGTTIELRNPFLAWGHNEAAGAILCNALHADGTIDCSYFNNSKCSYLEGTIITATAPLSTNFTWDGNCIASNLAETITFTSQASGGTEPYTYSWNFGDGSPVLTGDFATAGNPTHAYAVAGTYSVTLTLTDVSNPMRTVSANKSVTVESCCVAPTITVQPQSKSVCLNGNTSFSVAYTGGNPSPTTVTWEYNKNDGMGWQIITDADGNPNTLSLTGVTASMNGYTYRAVLTNGSCAPLNSNGATLTVLQAVAPTFDVTAATCGAAGSVTISNYDAAVYDYTITVNGMPVATAASFSVGAGLGYSVSVAFKSDATCTASASGTMNTVVPAVAPTFDVTAATCGAAGSVSISNYDAAVYNYTITVGGSPVASASSFSVAAGASYSVAVSRKSDASCTASNNGTMNQVVAAVAPTFDVTAATCDADGLVTISNYDAAVYNYTITVMGSPIASAASFGVAAGGSYSVAVSRKSDASCTAAANGTMNTPEGAVKPDLSVTAATCGAPGSVTIENYNSTLFTYTITVNGSPVASASSFSVPSAGTYNVVAVRKADASCDASDGGTMNTVVPAVAPTFDVTAATCGAAGSVSISNYDAAVYNYTITVGGSPVASASSFSVAAGASYSVAVSRKSDASCTASNNGTMNQVVAAVAPTFDVTAATCDADGLVTISNYDAAVYNYTITVMGSPIASAASFGVAAGGSYSVAVSRKSDASCTAAANGTMNTPEGAVKPDLSVTAATCGAPGSVTIENYNSTLFTYTITVNGSPVASASSFSVPSAGTYNVVAVRKADASCDASDGGTMNTVVPAVAPTFDVTAATCGAAGSVSISNYDAAVYNYTITVGGSPVASASSFSVAAGASYSVAVSRKTDASCTASNNGTMNQVVAAVAPTFDVTAATCDADGLVTISNYDAAVYNYTITVMGSPIASAASFGVAAGGSYSVAVSRKSDATCTASANGTMNTPEGAVKPTLSVTAATCGAAGSVAITNYNSTLFTYTITVNGSPVASASSFSVPSAGTYNVVAVRKADASCDASDGGTMNTVVPAVAPAFDVTAATCGAAGSVSISNYDAAVYNYTITVGGSPVASASSFSVAAGASYSVAVSRKTDASCTASNNGTMNTPVAAVAPTFSVTNATCGGAGSVSISNYDAAVYNYTITVGGLPVASASSFSVAAGASYSVAVARKSDASCTASNNGTMNTPEGAVKPTLSVTAATCGAVGSVAITNYNATDFNYTITVGGSPVASASSFSVGSGASYNVVAVRKTDGSCEASDGGTMNTVVPAVAPTFSVTNATCGAAGSVTISNYDAAVYNYTITVGGSPVASASSFSVAAGASYSVAVSRKSDASCTASNNGTMNTVPPTGTVAGTISPVNCSSTNGTVTITSPLDNGSMDYHYSVNGGMTWTDETTLSFALGSSYSIIAELKSDPSCDWTALTGQFQIPNCTYACGYTQGYWGNKNGLATMNSKNLLSTPLYLGRGDNMVVIPAGYATQLNRVLPGGKTPAALKGGISTLGTADFASKYLTGGKINNNLLSQTITLSLNCRIPGNALSSFAIMGGCLTTTKGVFTVNMNVYNYLSANGANAVTVNDLLALANDLLGKTKTPGVNGVPSYSDVTSMVDMFNNAFDECATSFGYSQCTTTYVSTGSTTSARIATVTVSAYPNPYVDKIRFEITSPSNGKGALEIYNHNGQKIANVYQGEFRMNEKKTVEYRVPDVQRKTLNYSFTINGQRVSGTVIHQ